MYVRVKHNSSRLVECDCWHVWAVVVGDRGDSVVSGHDAIDRLLDVCRTKLRGIGVLGQTGSVSTGHS